MCPAVYSLGICYLDDDDWSQNIATELIIGRKGHEWLPSC